MGFGKNLGSLAGKIVGGTVHKVTCVASDLTGIKFIEEVGESAMQVTVRTGETVGRVADGIGGTVRGVAAKDANMVWAGLGEAGTAVGETVQGVAVGVAGVVAEGAQCVGAAMDGDYEKAKACGRNLAKVAVIGAISVGIADVVGIIDLDLDAPDHSIEIAGASDLDLDVSDTDGFLADVPPPEFDISGDEVSVEDLHEVRPHWVAGYERADGTYVDAVWRDGTSGHGYWQSNPDGDLSNNLKA